MARDVADLTNVYYGLVGSGGSDSRCDDSRWLVDWNDCLTDAVVRTAGRDVLPGVHRRGVPRRCAGVRLRPNRVSVGLGDKIYHFAAAFGGLNNTDVLVPPVHLLMIPSIDYLTIVLSGAILLAGASNLMEDSNRRRLRPGAARLLPVHRGHHPRVHVGVRAMKPHDIG